VARDTKQVRRLGDEMSSVHQTSIAVSAPALNPMSFGWVMKRLALGIFILVVAVGSVAWLTYASIEQSASQSSPAETAANQ
jgi:hypothetical protein